MNFLKLILSGVICLIFSVVFLDDCCSQERTVGLPQLPTERLVYELPSLPTKNLEKPIANQQELVEAEPAPEPVVESQQQEEPQQQVTQQYYSVRRIGILGRLRNFFRR